MAGATPKAISDNWYSRSSHGRPGVTEELSVEVCLPIGTPRVRRSIIRRIEYQADCPKLTANRKIVSQSRRRSVARSLAIPRRGFSSRHRRGPTVLVPFHIVNAFPPVIAQTAKYCPVFQRFVECNTDTSRSRRADKPASGGQCPPVSAALRDEFLAAFGIPAAGLGSP